MKEDFIKKEGKNKEKLRKKKGKNTTFFFLSRESFEVFHIETLGKFKLKLINGTIFLRFPLFLKTGKVVYFPNPMHL